MEWQIGDEVDGQYICLRARASAAAQSRMKNSKTMNFIAVILIYVSLVAAKPGAVADIASRGSSDSSARVDWLPVAGRRRLVTGMATAERESDLEAEVR